MTTAATEKEVLDLCHRWRRALQQAVRHCCRHAVAEVNTPELVLPFGFALARRVMQSDLYRQLDDTERAECNALALAGGALKKAA